MRANTASDDRSNVLAQCPTLVALADAVESEDFDSDGAFPYAFFARLFAAIQEQIGLPTNGNAEGKNASNARSGSPVEACYPDFGGEDSSWRDVAGPFYAEWLAFRLSNSPPPSSIAFAPYRYSSDTSDVGADDDALAAGKEVTIFLDSDEDKGNSEDEDTGSDIDNAVEDTTGRQKEDACCSIVYSGVTEESVRKLVAALRNVDPRYVAHMAANERRRDVATSMWELSKEDRKMFVFLNRDSQLEVNEDGEDDADVVRVEQRGTKDTEDPLPKSASRRAAKVKTGDNEKGEVDEKGASTRTTKKKLLQDNFTKGQLLKEAPKDAASKAGAKETSSRSSKKSKRVANQNEGQDDADDFADAIVCAICGMDFTSEKKRQEHYRKFPEHDPIKIEESKRAAAQLRLEEESGAKEKGNNKPKQKRHGHRKF
ncbi:unnamed protein product [Amoebophrya sp. A25]|nr:unnamed protein product [Amoebophrya sp. A25]|eukprot:GSA25T00007801001.1